MIDSNDFFMDDLFEPEKEVFDVDVKTLTGRNEVLNFIGKMEFEIKTLGFSNVANSIAYFYEKCKKTKGIVAFESNEVIQFIKQEMKTRYSLRLYLNERIFNFIEEDKLQQLNHIFDNNDQKFEENRDKTNKYILKKQKLEKELQEKAKKSRNKDQNITYALTTPNNMTNPITGMDTLEDRIRADFRSLLERGLLDPNRLPNNGETNVEISLDDTTDDNTNNSDNFWGC